MSRRILIGLAAVAAAAAAAGATAAPHALAPAGTYPDRTGDSGSAPDLAQAVVTDEGDLVRFEITLASVPDLADSTLVVLLDTDRNRDTGNAGGDYVVVADENGVGLAHAGAEGWEPAAHQPLQPRLSNGVLSFALARTDVGSAAAFDFVVAAVHGEESDSLPDGFGFATYPAHPQIARVIFPASVLLPRAGTVLRAGSVTYVLAEGSPQAEIRMSCRLTRNGKALRPQADGCSWRLPKSLKHAKLTLSVTFSSGDVVLLTKATPLVVG